MELWIDALRKTSLTKSDLCEQLSEQMGLTQRESREIVEGFFEIVGRELARGETVKLANFGTFHIRTKAARPGRNLRTSEQVEVHSRRAVTFFTGPKLRSLLHPDNPAPPAPQHRNSTPVSSGQPTASPIGLVPTEGMQLLEQQAQ